MYGSLFWSRFLPTFLASSAVTTLPSIVTPSASTSSSAATPQSTACGDVVNSGSIVFNASQINDCLESVPFNAAVATRFLQYFNDTLQFQSTLAYLKNPPPSYQQQPVDMMKELDYLQQAVNNGSFVNQYQFEAAVQALITASHDGHLYMDAGVLSTFYFASPYDIVSISLDGLEPPKVYLAADLIDSSAFTLFQPSAVETINGQDVTSYLDQFAALNSPGTLEPHAQWNQLMYSAAQEIQGLMSTFSGAATFYPGDTITFGFENGTSLLSNFLGIYYSPGATGPLETGGDFYNFFVLGLYPESYYQEISSDDAASAVSSVLPSSTAAASAVASSSAAMSSLSAAASSVPTGTGWDFYPVYPDYPDVVQPELGLYGGGVLTGYFLNSTSTAVLSIPSFDEYGDAIDTFQDTVSEFLSRSRAAGLRKVVVDLQQNTGGQVLLAIDAFRRFFPNVDPFAGSRMRAHFYANTMGETVTEFFNDLAFQLASTNMSDEYTYYYDTLAADEWVATDRLNAATNANFSSWAEFFGPHSYYGDNFTTTQRYNLSSEIFDESAINNETTFVVFSPSANETTPPYAAEDIILLTDGLCDSACAIFLEMMHHEAGVRVVAAGGRPVAGPMQGASGTRGARDYSLFSLDENIDFVQTLLMADANGTAEANLLPNRTLTGMYILDGGINLRDQVRRNETMPLQFVYDAADCRIYYTPQTIWNYTALWQYAADAVWTNSSLCVANSTGYATTGTNKTDISGPLPTASSSQPAAAFHMSDIIPIVLGNSSSLPDASELAGDLDALQNTRNSQQLKNCTVDTDCGNKNEVCRKVTTCLGQPAANKCVALCFGNQESCNVNGRSGFVGKCVLDSKTDVKIGSSLLHQGFCNVTAATTCNAFGAKFAPLPPP